MSSSDIADRNLLFGMLAVQMDFVSRDQLFDAMQVWMFEKTKPLGRILVERSALEPDTCSVLDALVSKHVARHEGDLRKSLVAAGSRGIGCDELARLGDTDIDASLASFTPTLDEDIANDPLRTQSYAATWSEAPIGGRYRVLRPHARGGLGAVFVALDSELNREVALKEIHERHADDPSSRVRFQLEAEINGGLEHPGIVPVYGLGCHADGRPYYVMRFIPGDTFKEAIETFHRLDKRGDRGAWEIAFRKLLRRFLDVCNAIEYAHSRGILHRDIKPSNVMLGRFGETLVVDWGLAKVVGRPEPSKDDGERSLASNASGGSTETIPGSTLGTPAFMSPEQAVGNLEKLGPASDVYSLGATLFTLLTGRPPFEGPDIGEILRRVGKGDFPSPRKVDPSIPVPMEAVCLKAMALDPSARFPSARALADDIDLWLADEPLISHRESPIERCGRWSRRHKTVLAAAMSGLFVAMIAVFLGLFAVQKSRSLAIQRAQFDADFELAESALAEIRQRIDAVAALDPSRRMVRNTNPIAPKAMPSSPGDVGPIPPPIRIAPRGPDPAVMPELKMGAPDPPTSTALADLHAVITRYEARIDKRRSKFDKLSPGLGGFAGGSGAASGVIGD